MIKWHRQQHKLALLQNAAKSFHRSYARWFEGFHAVYNMLITADVMHILLGHALVSRMLIYALIHEPMQIT